MLDIPSGIYNYYFEGMDYLMNSPYIYTEVILVHEIKAPQQSLTYEDAFSNLDSTETAKTESIRLRMYHAPKDWLKTGGIEFKEGRVQIIGYLEDKDKLIKCSYILAKDNKYILAGPPVCHGFEDRYFMGYLDLV